MVFLFGSCEPNKSEIKLIWKNKQAVGISIPTNRVGKNADSLRIQLLGPSQPTAILGNFTQGEYEITFEPLIPFTQGLRYEIIDGSELIEEISIPSPNPAESPSLLAIFPSQDTVPENLLKIYLKFSQPMQEGQSSKYLTVVKNKLDTLNEVFLDLPTELWNDDGTVLTVWLDPGRIKRDLHPNKKLGAPLEKGDHYELRISEQWKDKQGSKLTMPPSKFFIATSRDSVSPSPKSWTLKRPAINSTQPLVIGFKEALDYSLINSSLRVMHAKGNLVTGIWQTGDEEKQVLFLPNNSWTEGTYVLQIETRLEDLAGNNINRLFERDLKQSDNPVSTENFVQITFPVK